MRSEVQEALESIGEAPREQENFSTLVARYSREVEEITGKKLSSIDLSRQRRKVSEVYNRKMWQVTGLEPNHEYAETVEYCFGAVIGIATQLSGGKNPAQEVNKLLEHESAKKASSSPEVMKEAARKSYQNLQTLAHNKQP